MAVAFDAKMTAGNSSDGFNQEADNATSISSTGITVGSSANLLVAVLTFGGSGAVTASGITMTWGGSSMTAGPLVTSAGSSHAQAAIFYRVNPAPGAQTLAANWTNTDDCYMSAVSFTGGQVKTADNATATDVTSITITSDTDGATVAVFAVNGATPTVNFNKIFAEAPLAPGGGASYQLGGSSNGHTFTGAGGTVQALAGIHVESSGGAPGQAVDSDYLMFMTVQR